MKNYLSHLGLIFTKGEVYPWLLHKFKLEPLDSGHSRGVVTVSDSGSPGEGFLLPQALHVVLVQSLSLLYAPKVLQSEQNPPI